MSANSIYMDLLRSPDRLLRFERPLFLLMAFILVFQVVDLAFPMRTTRHYSATVEAADGTVLYAFLSNDDKWRLYTKADEITPMLEKAVLHKEDRWFYWHPGFNPVSIIRALVNNLAADRRTSGASTITMQVARLLEPSRRTYKAKLTELFRAIQLEWNFSKKEILQLYLNLVPYGGNIEGIKSASYLFFGKNPTQLSLAEITTLAIVPNRPTSLKLGRNNDLIRHERDKWLKRYLTAKVFPPISVQDALEEPLNAYRHPAPRSAPHFCRRMKLRYPDKPIIETTLRYNVQLEVEDLVRQYMQQLAAGDIHHAAVIILDNRSHEVVAYVGSPDFYNYSRSGQVDGVKAVRSPGSTLKPLIYGLAFDRGLSTPRTILTDVPVNFSGYSPENYDESFHGRVTVADALARSLNIPAVKTLDALKPGKLLDVLEMLNFNQIKKDREKLGLSVALGGCGVSLEELAGLYSVFANQGNYYAPVFVRSEKARLPEQILSAESAFMVATILTKLRRYDLPNRAESVFNLPRIGWKTGTSYGRRDAWSIGFNGHFTVAVWTGNFDGKGIPELTGSDIATPLMLQLFSTIDKQTMTDWMHRPDGLQQRLVCSESGMIPQAFCTDQVIDDYIPGISPYGSCEHLKKTWVNTDGSVSYCGYCLPDSGWTEKMYPVHPPELLAYFEDSHMPYIKIPAHNASCNRVWQDESLRIVKPNDGLTYYIDRKQDQELELLSQAGGDVETVSWFVNGKFLGSRKKSEPLFIRPVAGEMKITCTDEKGRTARIRITCTYL